MTISETIILGTITGILSAIVLLILGQIFHKIVLPWYQELIYKGMDISGMWKVHFREDEGQATFDFHFKQKAHRLSGDCLVTKEWTALNKTTTIHHYLEGYLWEGYLTLNMLPKDRSKISYSTGL